MTTEVKPRPSAVQRFERINPIHDGTDLLIRSPSGFWYFGKLLRSNMVDWSLKKMAETMDKGNWRKASSQN